MSTEYRCPNCKAIVKSAALSCGACGASFSEGAAWKPQRLSEIENPQPTKSSVLLAAVALSVLCSAFFPLGSYAFGVVSGGMYGPVFKQFSPAVFLALSYFFNYAPMAIFAWFLLRRFSLMERVPHKYRGSKLFGVGLALLALYIVLRVLAASVPGGGAGFAVASLSPLVVIPALVLLATGAVRLIYGLGKGAV